MLIPAELRFIVHTLTYTLTDNGYLITCYTNNPCHLWMRYTTTTPQKHIHPTIVRGAPVGTYIDQCFVAFTDLEQNEPGDTFTHTFTAEPWPHCQTRWYYFWGTVGPTPSPSASAIFQKHRWGLTGTSDCQLTHTIWRGFCQEWAACSQTFQPDHDYNASKLLLKLSQLSLLRKGHYYVKITLVGGNCWAEPILWSAYLDSQDLPVHPDDTTTPFSITPLLPVQKGTTYRILVHTVSPWYYWDGTRWKLGNEYAALYYRAQPYTNPYPRGGESIGCNFRDSSGSFPPPSTTDWYFCIYEQEA